MGSIASFSKRRMRFRVFKEFMRPMSTWATCRILFTHVVYPAGALITIPTWYRMSTYIADTNIRNRDRYVSDIERCINIGSMTICFTAAWPVMAATGAIYMEVA